MRFTITRSPMSALAAAICVLLLAVVISDAQAAPPTFDASNIIDQAWKFFDTGMAASQSSSLVQRQDSQAAQMLSDSISMATDLINNYRENGLTNMPNLPNLPGLNTIMRLPDKLLRAELSMLQDEIKMAQQMMQNPISATMNAPKDLASMLARMAEQLEQ